MLDEPTVRRLLNPLRLDLSSDQVSQLIAYCELLMRWNKKVNLTAIVDSEECITRHFGESLSVSRWVRLSGGLLDIGSGAGFPGLSLKIVFPELAVTLLEPVGKKRAFLKEVARTCGMNLVEVRGERLEDFVRAVPTAVYDAATARAVGHLGELIPLASRCLKPGADLLLWLSYQQAADLGARQGDFERIQLITLPEGFQGEIWWGKKAL